jgi:hypothetical protein
LQQREAARRDRWLADLSLAVIGIGAYLPCIRIFKAQFRDFFLHQLDEAFLDLA